MDFTWIYTRRIFTHPVVIGLIVDMPGRSSSLLAPSVWGRLSHISSFPHKICLLVNPYKGISLFLYVMVSHYIKSSKFSDGKYFPISLANDSSSTSSIWKTDKIGLVPMSPKASSTGFTIADTTAKVLPGSQCPYESSVCLSSITSPTK